ncbi:MAG: sigma-54 dependent transcriptional regulator [Candidatus Zixiibacteriota bacterium]
MRILLADDDDSVRRVIQFKLEKKGFDVTSAADGLAALDILKADRFDLLLADIRMPGLDGLELLEASQKTQPGIKVILITAHAEVSQAVRAVKLGAFDYITKPFEDEELFVAIDKALAFKKLEKENTFLKSRLKETAVSHKLVGVSKAFKDVIDLVNKIARTDATVLLTGESGTGKELIARTIHENSDRAAEEFVAVNCAAIPRDLLESELFGHVRGAFTGAIRDKKGKFELAAGGTLLLDEIGDLAVDLQAKLLRVLQEQSIEPVGSELKKDIDIRLIAATNVDLRKKVADGNFREDLFYRLNVIPIHIPPLRERTEDIPVLVQAFIDKFAGDTAPHIIVEPAVLEKFQSFAWPGNIRELENIIERMIILRRNDRLTLSDVPIDVNTSVAQTIPLPNNPEPDRPLSFHETEKKLVVDALNACGWNRTKASKYLNIPRHVLVYRMKKYDIREA